MITRCAWVNSDPLYMDYHDNEWGRPVYDERLLFEFLILEGMQAGLSWITILKKREHFRIAFDGFDPVLIASYDDNKINMLMSNANIIRNGLKIKSAITNAQAFLKLKQDKSSFADYLWNFVDGKPIKNHWQTKSEVPAYSSISDCMSKDLKQRGFKFIGSTICYAFMQATGMVNDHTIDCFCYPDKQ